MRGIEHRGANLMQMLTYHNTCTSFSSLSTLLQFGNLVFQGHLAHPDPAPRDKFNLPYLRYHVTLLGCLQLISCEFFSLR
jgi:hypothetical protein